MPCTPTSYVAGGPLLVTSTTRPTGNQLYSGMWIEELDTGRTLKYDGTGWVIMSEPTITTFLPVVTAGSGTLTTVSAISSYHRSNGWLTMKATITLTTVGTGATSIIMTVPVAGASGVSAHHVGSGTVNVTGSMVQGLMLSPFTSITYTTYNNLMPMGSGQTMWLSINYPMTTRYS